MELASYFLSTASGHAEKIREASERNELDLLQRTAHSFKNSCHNIGAKRLAKICGALEKLNDTSSSKFLLIRLERETSFALAELSALISQRKAS